METAAVFMHWPVIVEEPERILDDLARWTGINTLLFSISNPRNWTGSDRQSTVVLPAADGFEGLSVQVSSEEYDLMNQRVDLAKSKGFKIVCHVCPSLPFSKNLAALDSITIQGKRSDESSNLGMIWGCPNNPGTVQYGVALVRGAVKSWSAADMLELNHVEFPLWPRLGLVDLLVCFCDFCREKAQATGIDFEGMKRGVASFYEDLMKAQESSSEKADIISSNVMLNFFIKHSHIAEWLSFRMSSMSDFIRTVTAAARETAAKFNPNLKIGMDFFLPSASNLLGTDFASLYHLFDWVSPKFPDYVPGTLVPLAADEIASKSGRGTAAELRVAIRELLDLGKGPVEYQPIDPPSEDLFYSNAFDTSIIERQMKYLQPLGGKVPMYPWIWLHNRDLDSLRRKIEAIREHGFDGFFWWCWEVDFSSDRLKKLQGVL
jgi:hypothetical protein